MRTATATTIFGAFAAALGVAAMLRALLIAGVGEALDTNFVEQIYALFSTIAVAGVTVALFAGVVLLHARRSAGRLLLAAGGIAGLILTLVEIVVWVGFEDAVWSADGVIGAHRWAWAATVAVTTGLALLPAVGRFCSGTGRVTAEHRGVVPVAVAVAAFAVAAYLGWLARRQYGLGRRFIEMGSITGSDLGAVWSRTFLETVAASAGAAVVLAVGAALMLAGARAGRWLVVAGAVVTLGQAVYGWTDFDQLLVELGARDLLQIFAPRTAVAVVFTVLAPVVVVVLALLPSRRSPR